MNGTASIEHSFNPLTPRAERVKEKRRELTRFILAVFSTNILLSTLFIFSGSDSEVLAPQTHLTTEGHSLITLSLKSLLPEEALPAKVSLFNSSGALVISGAQLLGLSDTSSLSIDPMGTLEVKLDDLSKLIPYQQDRLIAHPYLEEHASIHPRKSELPRRQYEILF
jgi:hypothetical protein